MSCADRDDWQKFLRSAAHSVVESSWKARLKLNIKIMQNSNALPQRTVYRQICCLKLQGILLFSTKTP